MPEDTHSETAILKLEEARGLFDKLMEKKVSAKSMTQQRRASGKAASTVTLTESMPVTLKKDNFLSNHKNKQRFLSMPSKALQNVGCITHYANGDADLLIVKTAVESPRTSTTVLVGDDTDLLVLLCYHASEDGYDLYFRPEPKANARGARAWHVKKVKEKLGKEVCRNLLFLHAITGCGTTSRLYGVGRATALKKFENVLHFKEQSNVFSCHSAVSDVVTACEKALVSLFGGKPGVGLNALRYQRYFENLASKTSHIEPQNLPFNSSSCPISQPARLPTGKAVAGRVLACQWKTGGGKSLMIKYFLLQRTCRLPQNRFFS